MIDGQINTVKTQYSRKNLKLNSKKMCYKLADLIRRHSYTTSLLVAKGLVKGTLKVKRKYF